jgi:hypothetical protein
MRVNVSDVRIVTDKILSHLEGIGVTSLEIDWDYYWHIPKEQWHDTYQRPTAFTVGQISDDWQELKRIADGDSAPVGYALVWLSSVLRALGENVVG